MASFETGIGGPQGSPVTPQDPVVDRSEVLALDTLQDTFKQAFEIFADSKKGGDDGVGDSLKEFDAKAKVIGEGFKTGALNKAKARIELNNAWQSAVQTNPKARTALNDSYTKHGGAFGITAGKTIDQVQDEQRVASAEWAIENGYATTGMDTEDFQDGVVAGEAMRVHLKQLESQNAILQNINNKVDLDEKTRGIQEDRVRENIENTLREVSETSYVKYENQTKSILNNFLNNQTPEGEADSLERIAGLRADLNSELARISQGRVDKELLASLSAAHVEILDLAEKRIRGEINDGVLKRETSRIKLQSQRKALEDPEIRRLNGLVAVVGDTIVSDVMASKIAARYMSNYTETGELDKVSEENKEEASIFRNLFKDVGKDVNTVSVNNPPEIKDRNLGELQTYTDASIEAMVRDVVDRPSDITPIIEFFADRNINSLFNKGELKRPANAEGIANLIEVQFTNNVIRSMNTILGQQITFEGKQVTLDSVFERKLEGGRYRFVMRPEFGSLTNLRRDPKSILKLRGKERANALASAGGLAKAEQTLRGLTNTLNNTVMAISSLTGDSPAQAANQIQENLFNEPEQAAGELRPDELGDLPEENRVPSLNEKVESGGDARKEALLEAGINLSDSGAVGKVEVGTVLRGHIFKGGNPSVSENWVPINRS